MLRTLPCAALLLVLSSLPAAAGPVTLLSRADPDRPSGTPGGMSDVVGISADGRYVALFSRAANLLDGMSDANAGKDLFLHDRIAGTTVLVSHAAGDPSTTGNAEVLNASFSADGRWIAFRSEATDLVIGQVDSTNDADIFLWDRDSGVISLVSHEAGLPTTAAGGCWVWHEPRISADGGRVVFSSDATGIMAREGSLPALAVFLHDRATGTNALVSYASENAVLSADGNWVVFMSRLTDLVPGQIDANGASDTFLYEVSTGTIVLVSHAAGSAITAGNASNTDFFMLTPLISADGSWVAYSSNATNLVAGQTDGNDAFDLFLYDRSTGTNTLVSHTLSSATATGNWGVNKFDLSADGRYVAFESSASDLVAAPPTLWWDIFVYDRVTGTNALVSRRGTTPANGFPLLSQISSDGAWIAFSSTAANLVAGQIDTANGNADAFVWSRASGSITLVSRTTGSAVTSAGGTTSEMRISADGGWIALASNSENLVDGADDYNVLFDVYLYERATGANSLITSRGGEASAAAGGRVAYYNGTVMSNDGGYIAFTSAAPNLQGVSDENQATDVFLYDRVAGATRLVSSAIGSPSTAADAASHDPVVSADGIVIVFESDASDLVSGPASSSYQGKLYLYDRITEEITLISHTAASTTTPAPGGISQDGAYTVSGDGRWIAFAYSGSLVAGQVDANGGSDIFLFDRATGANILVSRASSSPTQAGNGPSNSPSISADGRYIAFESGASDLAPGQIGAGRIFLYDRVTGTITQVSSSGNSTLGISADGRWVVFTSNATNVVPGQVDTNSASDVFLWDRMSGSTLLVSRTTASPVTTGNSGSGLSGVGGFLVTSTEPILSADGRWVAFYSGATNLISGQTGSSGGIFLFDRTTGTVTLVSRSAASATSVRSAIKPALSADGRFVAYLSQATDLVPGQMERNSSYDFFLYDRTAGTTALVSHVPSSDVTTGTYDGDIGAFAPRISADGAWIAFHSPMSDLVAGDHDGTDDAFLYANPLPGRDLYTVPPCRIVDTRQAGQGPILTSGLKRMVMVHGVCGIPATARAVAVNVTVSQPSASGNLSFYAGDLAPSGTSTINFPPGETRANNAILSLAYDGSGTVAVTPFVAGGGAVHLIVDVSGYFE